MFVYSYCITKQQNCKCCKLGLIEPVHYLGFNGLAFAIQYKLLCIHLR